MKLFGRRHAMQMLGAGAVATPMAASQVLGAARAGLGTSSMAFSSQPMLKETAAPWDPVKDALRKTLRTAQREADIRLTQRWNGMDPDIASFHLPIATKARMQAERDLKTRTLLERLQDEIYGS